MRRVTDLDDVVEQAVRESGFSGVVRVDAGGQVVLERAYGLADRAHGIAMTADTRLGTASGSKIVTALAVLSPRTASSGSTRRRARCSGPTCRSSRTT